jgi:DNA gyrase/topoisomerase IV subunit B
VTNFEDYVKMYTKDGVDDLGQPLTVVAEKIAKGAQDVRWEVAVTVSPDEEFRQVSFVNGIATTKVKTIILIFIFLASVI